MMPEQRFFPTRGNDELEVHEDILDEQATAPLFIVPCAEPVRIEKGPHAVHGKNACEQGPFLVTHYLLAMCAAVLVHGAALASLAFWLVPGVGKVAGPLLTLDFVSLGTGQEQAAPTWQPGLGDPLAASQQPISAAGDDGLLKIQPAERRKNTARSETAVSKISVSKKEKSVAPLPLETASQTPSATVEPAVQITASASSQAEAEPQLVSPAEGVAGAPVSDTSGGGTPHGQGDKEEGLAGSGSEGLGGETRAFGTPGGPAILRLVKPTYPPEARLLGKEGVVILKLSIETSGRIGTIETVQSAGFGMEEAARDAILRSRFSPATLNGQPVACQALLPLRFKLQ